MEGLNSLLNNKTDDTYDDLIVFIKLLKIDKN